MTARSAIAAFANWRAVLREVVWAIATGIVSTVVSCSVLGINLTTITQRWQTNEADDHTQHYMVAKTITDSPFFGPNSRMGFPTAETLFFAPNWDPASAVIMRFEAFFTSDGILILNVYNVLGFFMVGFASYFFFRSLRVRKWIAIFFALVLSFAPYEYQRISFGHAFVANFWAVPLLGILVLITGGARTNPFEKWIKSAAGPRMQLVRRLLPIVVITLLVSLSLSYYYVFAAIILGGLLLMRLLGTLATGKHVKVLLWPIVTVGLLFVFIVIQLGVLSLNFGDRYSSYFGMRSPFESEEQAGRITSLLLPWTGSGFHLLAKASESYIHLSKVAIYAEPPGTPIVAALAMVLLMMFVLVKLLRSTSMPSSRGTMLGRILEDPRNSVLSFGFLWGLLFYTVTGLGVMFALIVSPEIRAWVRMSIVLITFSLGFLAVIIDLLAARMRVAVPIVVALGLIAAVDQLAGVPAAINLQPTTDSVLRTFVATAEDKLSANCGVVQLPLKGYPATGNIGLMTDYNEALPYIVSTKDSLRWSYGAVLGTKDADFWQAVSTRSEFAAAVRKSGACAIEVDTDAYVTPARVSQWKSWVSSVGDPSSPLVVSSDAAHRYRLFTVSRK